jgi:formylglycine-generating enzyme required for sulfatase activity
MKRKALKNTVLRARRGGTHLSGIRKLPFSRRNWDEPEYGNRYCGLRLIARKVR